jgi:hypothetical protein
MKKLLFIFAAVTLLCVSCTDSIEDKKKEGDTVYAFENDTCLIVYRHGASDPIMVKKPISLDELKKYNIPTSIAENKEIKKGMNRYIDGGKIMYIWNQIFVFLVLYLL